MNELIKRLQANPKIIEFLRYCIVGVTAVIIHYGLYLILNRWISINLAYTIGYVLSVCFHWCMTFLYTFREKITAKRTGGYLICNGVNYLLNMLFLNIFLYLGVPKQIAPIPVYCIVVPINFILVRTVLKRF